MDPRRDGVFVFVIEIGDDMRQVAPVPGAGLDPNWRPPRIFCSEVLRKLLFRPVKVAVEALDELVKRYIPVFIWLAETALVGSGVTMGIGTLFADDIDQRGAEGDLDPLDCIKEQDAKALVEEVEVDHLIEMGARAKVVAPDNLILRVIDGAEIPERITECAQAIVSDAPQRTQGMLSIGDDEPPKKHYIEALLCRPEGLQIDQHFEDKVVDEEDRAVAGRRGQARGHRS